MENKELQYQMLDRLRTDCEYFLGNGRANKDTLYYKDIDEHIAEMQALYSMLEEKPDWISYNQIEKYGKEMHERENIIDEYQETLKSIPENLEKYKNSLQINDYSINNYQLKSNIETIKDIVEHLEEIDKSKENINVLVLWSESTHYQDKTLYTLSEMKQKSLSATEDIYQERKRLELDSIYDKTKFILIGKDNNNLLLYKDRYDIGDYPSFIDDLKHGLSEEKYNKFAELDNSGLIASKALQEENTRVKKVKEFLNLAKDMDYKDYFAGILLNEVVESKQDIKDIQKQDLEVCDKFFNEYMKNDSMKLLSNEITDMINGKYEKKKEQEIEEDEDLE